MHHKVKKCRACGAVVKSGDAKCTSCHSNLKKRPSTFWGKKRKEVVAFLNKLLDIKIKTK